MMTDPPTDNTEAREPDAPDPTDAKHHAPLLGHTGGVPSDKALSDRRRSTHAQMRRHHSSASTSATQSSATRQRTTERSRSIEPHARGVNLV
eukprot:scaffold19371_cov129-Isochrysis_galbana.AAC.1